MAARKMAGRCPATGGKTAALLVAMRYGCHYSHCRRCDGRVGQSRRHDQEGGVSIVGGGGSAARTTRSLPSRLLLPICRSTCSGIWTSASIRGLHPLMDRRTPCAFVPHRPERVARTSVRARLRATRRGCARAPATGSPRALAYAAPTSAPCACGAFEDSAKIAKYSDEW